jgi:hypothetical protein
MDGNGTEQRTALSDLRNKARVILTQSCAIQYVDNETAFPKQHHSYAYTVSTLAFDHDWCRE